MVNDPTAVCEFVAAGVGVAVEHRLDPDFQGSHVLVATGDTLRRLGQPVDETTSACYGSGHTMPYTCTGVHLSGLSPQSTFTFVATWYVQICPLPGSPLATMVQPAPGYDPRVYEIYTRVMRMVPLATFKDDNDFGTWFRKVLGLVRNLAGPVSSAFGMPGVGTTVSGIAGAIDKAIERRQQQQQQRKQS